MKERVSPRTNSSSDHSSRESPRDTANRPGWNASPRVQKDFGSRGDFGSVSSRMQRLQHLREMRENRKVTLRRNSVSVADAPVNSARSLSKGNLSGGSDNEAQLVVPQGTRSFEPRMRRAGTTSTGYRSGGGYSTSSGDSSSRSNQASELSLGGNTNRSNQVSDVTLSNRATPFGSSIDLERVKQRQKQRDYGADTTPAKSTTTLKEEDGVPESGPALTVPANLPAAAEQPRWRSSNAQRTASVAGAVPKQAVLTAQALNDQNQRNELAKAGAAPSRSTAASAAQRRSGPSFSTAANSNSNGAANGGGGGSNTSSPLQQQASSVNKGGRASLQVAASTLQPQMVMANTTGTSFGVIAANSPAAAAAAATAATGTRVARAQTAAAVAVRATSKSPQGKSRGVTVISNAPGASKFVDPASTAAAITLAHSAQRALLVARRGTSATLEPTKPSSAAGSNGPSYAAVAAARSSGDNKPRPVRSRSVGRVPSLPAVKESTVTASVVSASLRRGRVPAAPEDTVPVTAPPRALSQQQTRAAASRSVVAAVSNAAQPLRSTSAPRGSTVTVYRSGSAQPDIRHLDPLPDSGEHDADDERPTNSDRVPPFPFLPPPPPPPLPEEYEEDDDDDHHARANDHHKDSAGPAQGEVDELPVSTSVGEHRGLPMSSSSLSSVPASVSLHRRDQNTSADRPRDRTRRAVALVDDPAAVLSDGAVDRTPREGPSSDAFDETEDPYGDGADSDDSRSSYCRLKHKSLMAQIDLDQVQDKERVTMFDCMDVVLHTLQYVKRQREREESNAAMRRAKRNMRSSQSRSPETRGDSSASDAAPSSAKAARLRDRSTSKSPAKLAQPRGGPRPSAVMGTASPSKHANGTRGAQRASSSAVPHRAPLGAAGAPRDSVNGVATGSTVNKAVAPSGARAQRVVSDAPDASRGSLGQSSKSSAARVSASRSSGSIAGAAVSNGTGSGSRMR